MFTRQPLRRDSPNDVANVSSESLHASDNEKGRQSLSPGDEVAFFHPSLTSLRWEVLLLWTRTGGSFLLGAAVISHQPH